MIQFNWRRLAHHETPNAEGVVTVDGHACVLEVRQYFTPRQLTGSLVDSEEKIIVLAEARECDKEWKRIVIK